MSLRYSGKRSSLTTDGKEKAGKLAENDGRWPVPPPKRDIKLGRLPLPNNQLPLPVPAPAVRIRSDHSHVPREKIGYEEEGTDTTEFPCLTMSRWITSSVSPGIFRNARNAHTTWRQSVNSGCPFLSLTFTRRAPR